MEWWIACLKDAIHNQILNVIQLNGIIALVCIISKADAGLCTGTVPSLKIRLWAALHRSSLCAQSHTDSLCTKWNEMRETEVWVGVSMAVFEHLNFSMPCPVWNRQDTEAAIWEMLLFSKCWVWRKEAVEQARKGSFPWPIWENKLNKDPKTLVRKVEKKVLQHFKANLSVPKHKVEVCSLNCHYRVPS